MGFNCYCSAAPEWIVPTLKFASMCNVSKPNPVWLIVTSKRTFSVILVLLSFVGVYRWGASKKLSHESPMVIKEL